MVATNASNEQWHPSIDFAVHMQVSGLAFTCRTRYREFLDHQGYGIPYVPMMAAA